MTLSTADLEHVYDRLAEAIDRAPEGLSELMLVKLVMLLAHEQGNAERLDQLLQAALQDLGVSRD